MTRVFDEHDALARSVHAALSSRPEQPLPCLRLLSEPGAAAKVARSALRRLGLWGIESALHVVGVALAKQHPGEGFAAVRKAIGATGTSGVCGVVWKRDELAYKCKTCERDPTCAICVPCFRHGDHKGHDYAMIRTGGGCCDCGDVQAWKSSGFCSRHNGASSETDDPAANIPRDLRSRISDVSAVVADRARIITTMLSGCMQNKNKSKLDDVTILAHTNTVCTLLQWLGELIECGDGVRRVVAIRLVKGDKHPWVRAMLRLDGCDRLPRQLQASLHALYYQFITDLVFKREFLELFVINYENFVAAYANKKALSSEHPDYYRQVPAEVSSSNLSTAQRADEDNEESRCDILESFTVQLFTVPALVPVMMRRGGLLDVLIHSLTHVMETSSKPVMPDEPELRNEQQVEPDDPICEASIQVPSLRRHALTVDVEEHVASHARSGTVGEENAQLSRRLFHEREACIQQYRFQGYSLSEIPRALLGELAQNDADGVEWVFGRIHPISQVTFKDAFSDWSTGNSDAREEGMMNQTDADAGSDLQAIVSVQGENVEHSVSHASADDEADIDYSNSGSDASLLGDQEEVRETSEQSDIDDIDLAVPDVGHDNVDAESRPESEQLEESFVVDVTESDVGEPQEDVPDFLHRIEEQDVNFEAANILIDTIANLDDTVADNLEGIHFQVVVPDGFGSQAGQPSSNALAPGRLKQIQERFLSVLESRRDAISSEQGPSRILHSLRVDWLQGQPLTDQVCWRIVYDLRYVLTHDDVATYLVHARPDLFRHFVRFLSMLQGMDPNIRKFGQHVSLERDIWAKAFTLEIEVFHIIEMIVGAFCRDPRQLIAGKNSESWEEFSSDVLCPAASRARACEIVRRCLDEWLHREEKYECAQRLKNQRVDGANFVSMHLPLHRLLSLFAHHMVRLDNCEAVAPLMPVGSGLQPSACAARLLKHPLRIQVFLAQVSAGMWRRNGRAVVGQSMLYRSVFCAESFVDLDIFMMQECMAVMGPSLFIVEVLSAFRLHHVLNKFRFVQHPATPGVGLWEYGANGCPDYAIAQQVDEYDPTLFEAMLYLFVHVATERARCGNTESENLRRKFVHLLSTGDQTHSHLTRVCPRSLLDKSEVSVESSSEEPQLDRATQKNSMNAFIDETLRSVSDFSEPHRMDQGRYCLRQSAWEEFDPFLPYFASRDRSTAEERFSEACRRQGRLPSCLPMASAVSRPLYDAFKDLFKLTWSLVGARNSVVAVFMRRCLQSGGFRSFEGSLNAALYIIATAVESGNALRIRDDLSSASCQPSWLQELAAGKGFRGSVLDSVVKMYKSSSCDTSSPFYDYRGEFPRILSRAYAEGQADVKSLLHSVTPELFAPPALENVSLPSEAPKHEYSASESREDERKKNLRRMKKEKQAAAMSLMQTAQAKFAAKLDGMLPSAPAISMHDGLNHSGSAVEGIQNAEHPDENSNFHGVRESFKKMLQSGANGAGTSASNTAESSINAECQNTRSNSTDTPELICALCREPETLDNVMGIIALAQNTNTPFLASYCSLADVHLGEFRESVRCNGAVAVASQTGFSSKLDIRQDREFALSDRPTVFDRILQYSVEQRNQDRENNTIRGEPRLHISEIRPSRSPAHQRSGESRLLCVEEHRTPSDEDPENESDQPSLADSVSETKTEPGIVSLLERGVDDVTGVHIGFCGHAVHVKCFERYFDSLRFSHARDDDYEGQHVLNVELGEFLCPVCRRLANIVVPRVNDRSDDFTRDSADACQNSMSTCMRDIAEETKAHLTGRISVATVTKWSSFSARVPDILPNSDVWKHAVDLIEILAVGYKDLHLNDEVPENCLHIIDVLCAAVLTTVESWEVALRSILWSECKTSLSRFMVGELLRQVRVQAKLVSLTSTRSSNVFSLLQSLLLQLESDRSECLLGIDPFACITFIMLMWPGNLTTTAIFSLARVGFAVTWKSALHRSDDPLLSVTHYLRRIAVLLAFLLRTTPPLEPYPACRRPASRENMLSDLHKLLAFLHVESSMEELSSTLSACGASCLSRIVSTADFDLPMSQVVGAHRELCKIRFVPRRWTLIPLPSLFQDLLEAMDGTRCDSCGELPRSPYLCLVCSSLICADKGCPGEVKQHAASCGSGIGVYLILKTTIVRVYRQNRRTNWGSPYLDEHGEEDLELHRGKPLHLSSERYENLNKLWLLNEFDHNARVLRHTMLV